MDSVDSVNGRNKRTCRKLDSLCTGKSGRDRLLGEDTHVAVVEKAPHMNEEELMLVFVKVVRWQHLCEMGLSRVVQRSMIIMVVVVVGNGFCSCDHFFA